MKKRRIVALVLLLVLFSSTVSCNEKKGSRMLSFSQAQSVSEMQKLDGEEVSIIGYMSTLSPVSGKFMYLMNLPYQSCPFCVPNTTQLSNTMAVYAKSEFKFTDRAIVVTGTLEFGEFTDEFGYQYAYRIKDATYAVLDTSDMDEELRLWQQLASTDVIGEIYTMLEYVNFLCFWPTYTATFSEGKDYLYPTDALNFIETEGAQFNYGFREGYFDGLIATVKSVDESAFSDLVEILEKARVLADRAYGELKNGNYSVVSEYSSTFGDGRTQYRLTEEEALSGEMKAIYSAFAAWIASWEL